jgi:hypothetical protein
MRRVLVPIVFVLAAAAPSAGHADTVIVQRPNAETRASEVRVQVAMNLFIPGPVNATPESFDAQENVRKAIYERAGRECETLKATLASECRLESINVSTNRQYGPPQAEGFMATGNMTYRITLK